LDEERFCDYIPIDSELEIHMEKNSCKIRRQHIFLFTTKSVNKPAKHVTRMKRIRTVEGQFIVIIINFPPFMIINFTPLERGTDGDKDNLGISSDEEYIGVAHNTPWTVF
jgi:hypothetical protein